MREVLAVGHFRVEYRSPQPTMSSSSSSVSSSAAPARIPKEWELFYAKAEPFDDFMNAARLVAHSTSFGNVKEAMRTFVELGAASSRSDRMRALKLERGDPIWVQYDEVRVQDTFSLVCAVQTAVAEHKDIKEPCEKLLQAYKSTLDATKVFYPPPPPAHKHAWVDEEAVETIKREISDKATLVRRHAHDVALQASERALTSSDAEARRDALDYLHTLVTKVEEHNTDLQALMDKLRKEYVDVE